MKPETKTDKEKYRKSTAPVIQKDFLRELLIYLTQLTQLAGDRDKGKSPDWKKIEKFKREFPDETAYEDASKKIKEILVDIANKGANLSIICSALKQYKLPANRKQHPLTQPELMLAPGWNKWVEKYKKTRLKEFDLIKGTVSKLLSFLKKPARCSGHNPFRF